MTENLSETRYTFVNSSIMLRGNPAWVLFWGNFKRLPLFLILNNSTHSIFINTYTLTILNLTRL